MQPILNDILILILSFSDIATIKNFTMNKFCLSLLSDQFFKNKLLINKLPTMKQCASIGEWCDEYNKLLKCQQQVSSFETPMILKLPYQKPMNEYILKLTKYKILYQKLSYTDPAIINYHQLKFYYQNDAIVFDYSLHEHDDYIIYHDRQWINKSQLFNIFYYLL